MESQATRALRQRQGLGDPTLELHHSGAMTSPASPAPLANAGPSYRITPTAVVLIAANLVPLAGVLFFGWSVFATLLLFWVENVIVGGGFLVMALGSPAVALALLVVLKTALDLRGHLREHLAAPQPLPA